MPSPNPGSPETHALLASGPARPAGHAVAEVLLPLAAAAVVAAAVWGRRRRWGVRPCTLLALTAATVGAVASGLAVPAASGAAGAAKLALGVLACGAAVSFLRSGSRLGLRSEPGDDVGPLRLLEAAVQASGDGVVIAEAVGGADLRLRIVYTNPAFERMTGYSSDEAVGLSPTAVADRDEEDSLAAVRAALRANQPTRLEVPGRRKDGQRVWAEWQVVPVTGRSGDRYAVAVLRDTTERRRGEQALRESESRFRGLFEHAADAIFLLDERGGIVDANPRACQTLGYSRDELTALALSDIDDHTRADRTAETVTAEGWHRRKDGTTFPVEVRFALLEAGGQRLNFALVRDLTRRKQAEQALREREALLRSIIAHIPCGVFWKDRDSVYLGCNDRVARDRGLAAPHELVGRTDLDLGLTPEEAASYRENDRRVLESEAQLNVEVPQTRRDGTRAVLLGSKVPLRDASGAVVGVLGVYQDITEHKRLEEQLRQSQKMEAVGRLAGGIAHDFNNLLTIILGNADLLHQEPLERRAAELVGDIHDAAGRAASLTRQLLMFSRRQPSRPEVVDLNEVVGGLAGILRRLLGERVTVRTSLAAEPVRVRADRSNLEQVVMNLAVNARDAMPDGGTLTIVTGLGAWVDGPTARSACLSVTDTGVGMTEEIRARIFDPFFTTKGPDKGTGLGLATVFGIVQQAGGRIDVESAPGAGTTFRIGLPECREATSRSTVVGGPGSALRKLPGADRSVLLVEDEHAVRKLARAVLESSGYAVSDAPDAEAALALVGNGRPVDLLVTDLTMPGIDGCELARRVRAANPAVRVVFMSGYVANTDRLGAVPGSTFLSKPFTPSDLTKTVSRVLTSPAVVS